MSRPTVRGSPGRFAPAADALGYCPSCGDTTAGFVEEECTCPVCERGPGPFDLICEFSGSQKVERRYSGTGPRTGEWEDQYPYRTWEINTPDNSVPHEWPENLIGLMPFEWEADLTDFCSWDIIS